MTRATLVAAIGALLLLAGCADRLVEPPAEFRVALDLPDRGLRPARTRAASVVSATVVYLVDAGSRAVRVRGVTALENCSSCER